MHFRIGINLGDVIVEGERLYGDGVNIAARLESLSRLKFVVTALRYRSSRRVGPTRVGL
jgi:class 3 adenylate cyclase